MDRFTNSMKITIVNDLTGFDRLHDSWNRLLESSDFDSVFMTHEWFSSFIRAFNLEKQMSIVLVYDSCGLVGILPLYREYVKYGFLRCLVLKSITNVHTPKYSFIFRKGAGVLLPKVLALLQRMVQWDMIQVDYISQDLFILKHPSLMIQQRFHTAIVPIMKSPRILLGGDWNTYYKECFSKSLRQNIEKSIRKTQRFYELSCEVIEGAKLTKTDLEEAFIIEDRGWKGQNGSSIIKNESFRKFYEQLAFQTSHNGWFALRFLKLGSRRVAFDYCLKYKTSYNLLKTGYDEKLSKYSPGHILRKNSIMDAFESGYAICDLLGASDNYKLKMANGLDCLYSMYIFHNGVISRMMKFILFDAKEIAGKIGIKDSLKEIYYRLRKPVE